MLADGRKRVALFAENEWKRASLALSHYHHDLTLACPLLEEAPINPLFGFVSRLRVPSKIRAVDFTNSRERRLALLVLKRLSKFVSENECRLVLATEITRELERAMALRAVGKNGDGKKIITNWALAVVEECPGRDAELMFAAATFPDRSRGEGADLETSAARAVGLAVVVGPPDAPEGIAGLLIRHTRHGAQRERPGSG